MTHQQLAERWCPGAGADLPVIPKRPSRSPHDKPGNKAIATCGECGRVIYQIEHYCCMDGNCPVQQRPTYLVLS